MNVIGLARSLLTCLTRDYRCQMNETLSLNTSLTLTEALQDQPEPLICAFYNPDFIIYSSLGSFYIPCLVMIVLYSRIFKVDIVSVIIQQSK